MPRCLRSSWASTSRPSSRSAGAPPSWTTSRPSRAARNFAGVTPEGTKYDIVMSDGAPNVSGNFAAESYTKRRSRSTRLKTRLGVSPRGRMVRDEGVPLHRVPRAALLHAAAVQEGGEQQAGGVARHVGWGFTSCASDTWRPPRSTRGLLDPRALFADYDGPNERSSVLSRARNRSATAAAHERQRRCSTRSARRRRSCIRTSPLSCWGSTTRSSSTRR